MIFKHLSNKRTIEEQFFKVPEHALRLAGFWPEINFNMKAVVWFSLHFAFLSFGAHAEMIFGVMNRANLTLALETFCPAMTKEVSILKMLIFVFYRRDIRKILSRLKELLTARKDDDVERLLIGQNFASTALGYSLFVYCSAHCTMMFFFMKPIIINLYKMVFHEDTIRDLPFRML